MKSNKEMPKNILKENTLNTDIVLKPFYESSYNLEGKKVKRLKLQGTAIVCDVPGINGRSYPKSILGPEVNRFVEKMMKRGRAAAELNHPRLDEKGEGKDYSVFEMNLFKTCAVIEELYFKGNELFCKMRVVEDHEAGKALKALIDAGYVPGFSLRGAGSVIDSGDGHMVIADDYRLITIDVVGNPSFDEQALITPVYEAMKGKKVQVLTEAIDNTRKEILLEAAIHQKIKTGRKQFNRKALVNLLENMNKQALF